MGSYPILKTRGGRKKGEKKKTKNAIHRKQIENVLDIPTYYSLHNILFK